MGIAPPSSSCSQQSALYKLKMVTGVGIDLVEIGRFRAMPDPEGFIGEILTEGEISEHPGVAHDAMRSATVFAVKEATLKALGCGLTSGSYWHDVRIDSNFIPTLSGAIKRIAGEKRAPVIHVSHSHSKKYVTAIVLIERSI